MHLPERLDNIYVIDTKMFGFDQYNAAYLIEGKEIALVDTGMPDQLETLRNGIRAHGFSPGDISYIFVTHSHSDHCGSLAPLLRENPEAKVYIHPLGSENLTDPSIAQAIRKKNYTPEMFARFVEMEPVPPSRIQYLNDGDVFDLGNGETLKVIFAPGHQPDGIVILEEKNSGLFADDLVGIYLMDADAHYAINPPKSDHKKAIESLQKLLDIPIANLYLSHYGICDRPKQVITRAINNIQQLLEIGIKYMHEGQPEKIADKVFEVIMPELEKLRPVRGEALYEYATREHLSSQVKIFVKYCQEKFKK